MTQYPPLPPGLDPNYVFSQVAPFVATVVLIVAVTVALRALFRTPVGEALAERIRQRTARRWGGGGGGPAEDPQGVAALAAQVNQLQAQVSELAERIDFAERMLAEGRERKLGRGAGQ